MPFTSADAGNKFAQLCDIMARLRAPDGCPWDREQTMATIRQYTLEETYEVLDAIDQGDDAGLCEELGDYMLQAVFYAQIAQEEGRFHIADSLDEINQKLIRRHPHVFGDATARTADDVKLRWDAIKEQEKAAKPAQPKGLLDSVPKAAPALMEAQQLTAKAAKVGFDWTETRQILDKLQEELAELDGAKTPAELEGEIGDLLFVLVNLARHHKVDAEQALRATNRKFRRRFGAVERGVAQSGKAWEETTLDEMEALWQAAKRQEQER